MYSTINKPLYRRSKEFGIYCNQLDGIKEILNEFLNESLKTTKTNFEKIKLDYEKLKKEDSEEAEIYFQHDYEPRRIATIELEETICFSSISFLFSQFEVKLNELAEITEEIFHYKITFNNYSNKCRNNNKGINRAKSFIIEASKIEISDLEGLWSKIKNFQNLRHCIVHRNGNVKKEESIIQFAKSNKNLNYHEPSDRIQVRKEFLEEFIIILFDYLEQMVIKLYDKNIKKQ